MTLARHPLRPRAGDRASFDEPEGRACAQRVLDRGIAVETLDDPRRRRKAAP